MSLFDDERRKKPAEHEIGSDLSLLSVEELNYRVSLLQAEILRLQQERQNKDAGRKAAENLFRS
jgi:uncharacterized small protein (DUF1192 family)